MKKKLWMLIIAACILLPTAVRAAGGHAVVVQMKDNSKVSFRLSDEPRMTFDGTQVVMSTNSQRLEYLCQNISRVYIADDTADGISSPTSGRNLTVSILRGVLSVEGMLPGQAAAVYSIDGKLLEKANAGQTGALRINFRQFAGKILILRLGDKSIKIGPGE